MRERERDTEIYLASPIWLFKLCTSPNIFRICTVKYIITTLLYLIRSLWNIIISITPFTSLDIEIRNQISIVKCTCTQPSNMKLDNRSTNRYYIFVDPLREYIGRSRGTNADYRLVRFIRYLIIFIGY